MNGKFFECNRNSECTKVVKIENVKLNPPILKLNIKDDEKNQ